jgi:hypothetical protein
MSPDQTYAQERGIGPSSPSPSVNGRKASKSISAGSRPPPLNVKRTVSYTQNANPPASGSLLSADDGSSGSGSGSGSARVRGGLIRRISTPNVKRYQQELPVPTEEDDATTEVGVNDDSNNPVVGSRGRSTSTSFVLPSVISGAELQARSAPVRAPLPYSEAGPSTWNNGGIYITPASPDELYTPPALVMEGKKKGSLLKKVYGFGENGVSRMARWVKPRKRGQGEARRRGSEESEKERGLEYSDMDGTNSITTTRASEESLLHPGARYWGVWKNSGDEKEDDESGYFSLPPTPPEERSDTTNREFEAELREGNVALEASLPTPALSTVSLSRGGSKLRKKRKVDVEEGKSGWWLTVYNVWVGCRSGTGGGKTMEVAKELGWTVGGLIGLFVVTAGIALWLIKSLPV